MPPMMSKSLLAVVFFLLGAIGMPSPMDYLVTGVGWGLLFSIAWDYPKKRT